MVGLHPAEARERDMIGLHPAVYSSPKRQHCLEEVMPQFVPEFNKKKLVDLCRTCWVRNDALSVFLILYPADVETLTMISSSPGWNTDSSSRACSFLNNITNFSFISTFVLTSNILATALQKKAIDIVRHIKW